VGGADAGGDGGQGPVAGGVAGEAARGHRARQVDEAAGDREGAGVAEGVGLAVGGDDLDVDAGGGRQQRHREGLGETAGAGAPDPQRPPGMTASQRLEGRRQRRRPVAEGMAPLRGRRRRPPPGGGR